MRRLLSLFLLLVTVAGWAADMALQPRDCAQNARARIGSILVSNRTRTTTVTDGVAGMVTQWSLAPINTGAFGWYQDANCDNMVSITNGSNVATSPNQRWVVGDVGKSIDVTGAGTAGAVLTTTISGFTNAGQITLTANASTTVTASSTSAGGLAMWGLPLSMTLKRAPLMSADGLTNYQAQVLDLSNLQTALVTSPGSSTPRTIANRAGDWVNVRDYGAVGDGIANDTAALSAALATGRDIDIPAGTYLYTPPLSITSNGQIIRGRNRFTTILKTTATAANAVEIGVSSSVSGVVMESIRITGNATNTCGIVLGQAAPQRYAITSRFRDVYVENFSATGAAAFRIVTGWWLTFSSCSIEGNYNGFQIPSTAVTTTITINEHTTIRNSTAEGFIASGGDTAMHDVTMRGMSFEYNAKGAIKITSTSSTVVLDRVYLEQNASGGPGIINIVGGSGAYDYNTVNIRNCTTDAPLAGYSMSLDNCRRSFIDDFDGLTTGTITTTSACEIKWQNMNNHRGSNFLATLRTLSGYHLADEIVPSTGYREMFNNNGCQFEGHIATYQPTEPTISAGGALGSGGSCVITAGSTDTNGRIELTFGASGWVAGQVCRVTFNKSYRKPPVVILYPASTKAGTEANTCGVNVGTVANGYFDMNFAAAESASGLCYWHFVVIE